MDNSAGAFFEKNTPTQIGVFEIYNLCEGGFCGIQGDLPQMAAVGF